MVLFPIILTCFIKCVHSQEDGLLSRILYGQVADITDFPYFATLDGCSAAIISDTWLLTAAHCVSYNEHDYYSYPREHYMYEDNYQLGSVWVGGNNDDTSQEHGYDAIVIYPDYYDSEDQREDNIALLKLAQPLKFSESVQAVALPQNYDEDEIYDAVLTVAGIERNEYPSHYNNHLMKMDVRVLNLHECLSHFSLPDRIRMYHHRHEFQEKICTKRVTRYVHDLPGLCYSDSGSPLVYNNVLVGLGISTDDDCRKTSVSMFTKVARYAEWIRFITGISTDNNTTYIPPREDPGTTEDYSYSYEEETEESEEDY